MALNKKLVLVETPQHLDANQFILGLKKTLEFYDNGLFTLDEDWSVNRKETLIKLLKKYPNHIGLEAKIGETDTCFYLLSVNADDDDFLPLVHRLPNEF